MRSLHATLTDVSTQLRSFLPHPLSILLVVQFACETYRHATPPPLADDAKAEAQLRAFDLDSKFGGCIGLTRLERCALEPGLQLRAADDAQRMPAQSAACTHICMHLYKAAPVTPAKGKQCFSSCR